MSLLSSVALLTFGPCPYIAGCRSKHIHFGLMSPTEIVNTAEFHVYERALYKVDAVVPQQAESRRHQAACCTPPRWLLDRCARPFTASLAATMQMPERRPQPSGVLDPRLGVSNKRSTCETCGQVRGRMIRKMIRVGDSGKEVRQAWGVLLRRPAAPCKEAHLAHFRPSSPASLPPPPCPAASRPQTLADCTGHFGYIQLELPVFHIGYFKSTVQVLQCICKGCSRVMLGEEERRSFLKCAQLG